MCETAQSEQDGALYCVVLLALRRFVWVRGLRLPGSGAARGRGLACVGVAEMRHLATVELGSEARV